MRSTRTVSSFLIMALVVPRPCKPDLYAQFAWHWQGIRIDPGGREKTLAQSPPLLAVAHPPLRALIDHELLKHQDRLEGETPKAAFDELGHLPRETPIRCPRDARSVQLGRLHLDFEDPAKVIPEALNNWILRLTLDKVVLSHGTPLCHARMKRACPSPSPAYRTRYVVFAIVKLNRLFDIKEDFGCLFFFFFFFFLYFG